VKPLLLLLATSLMLTGCMSHFKPPESPGTRLVTWVVSEDLHECAALKQYSHLWGCAKWSDFSCTIYTKPRTSVEVLGHEVRHCFEGHFHP
jgi:hypothetical protein